MLPLRPIDYESLNSRQKENFNYFHLAAVLARYGFASIRLTDDWQTADFIAQHMDGETFLKVQLKPRLAFDRKYLGKGIYVGFPDEGERIECDWYVYDHDVLLAGFMQEGLIEGTVSWEERSAYTFPRLTRRARRLLESWRVPARPASGP